MVKSKKFEPDLDAEVTANDIIKKKEYEGSGVKEFTGMFSAFVRLSEMMTKLNDLLEGIDKCKKCGKGLDENEAKLLKNATNPEVKKVLCEKHRKMFEELEKFVKETEEREEKQ
jgi:hypothetical protein